MDNFLRHRFRLSAALNLVDFAGLGAHLVDIEELLKILPHRYPMMMVDRIVDFVPGKHAVGLKNVTINEAYFQGHYPGHPIMPGVLILEAMAQAGAIAVLMDPVNHGFLPVIAAFDKVKFKRPVVPGDQLISTCELHRFRHYVGQMTAVATVDGEIAAQMEMTFKLVPGVS